MNVHHCIACGIEFQPASVDIVLCPRCGGPPEMVDSPARTRLQPEPAGTMRMPEPDGPVETSRTEQAPTARFFLSESDPPLLWEPGDTILDLYEVKKRIESGGMAIVYQVHHKAWDLDLAVKTPRAEVVGTADGLAAFTAEAEAWVDLGLHPHIVSCHYVRKLGREAVPRVFAEWVPGGSLLDWIRQGRLRDLPQILDLAIQFAWGLAYAHEKGLVHRDVKPENVLLTEDGVLKVTDFGLSRARGHYFTPPYASPEQAMGQETDFRTDLWSWGLSVLHMLLGERSWADGTIALDALEQARQDGLAIPETLADLLRSCFQDEPARRPASMQAAAERLLQVYAQAAGAPYPHEQPKAAELRADSLNNQALSMLDLGKEFEAEECWQQSLRIDPTHMEASFNFGYRRWQRSEISGSRYRAEFRALQNRYSSEPDYWSLLGWISLQQGDEEELKNYEKAITDQQLLAVIKSNLHPILRLLRRLGGSQKAVTSINITPDGQTALTVCRDQTLRLWNIPGGQEIRIMGPTGGETAAIFTPDGQRIVTTDGSIWDISSGKIERRIQGIKACSIALSIDGRTLLTGGQDNLVRIWDLAEGREIGRLAGHRTYVWSVAVSPDGRTALSGDWDNCIRWWDLTSRRELRCLVGHEDRVLSVAFSPDGQFALSGAADHTLRLWDLKAGKVIRRMEDHKGAVSAVAISHSGEIAVSGSHDRTVRVWDLADGREIRKLDGHQDEVSAIAITPQGDLALSGSEDGQIIIWQIDRPTLHLPGFPYPLLARVRNIHQVVRQQSDFENKLEAAQKFSLQAAPEKAYLLLREAQLLAGHDHDPVLLELLADCGRSGERVGLRDAWPSTVLAQDFSGFSGAAIVRDGRLGLSIGEEVVVWDLVRRKPICSLGKGSSEAISIALSPDAQYVAAGSFLKVQIWELKTRREISRLQGPLGFVRSVSFSPDGQTLLAGADDQHLWLWDVQSGNLLKCIQAGKHGIEIAAFLPGGTLAIAGGGGQTLTTWDLKRGKKLKTLRGHNGIVTSVAVSPDGKQALSGSWDASLRLWDLETACALARLETRQGQVNAVAYTPDGRFALSGGSDNSLCVWDLETSREVFRLDGHTHHIACVCISPDGRIVLTGSGDKTLRLWEFDWEYEFLTPKASH